MALSCTLFNFIILMMLNIIMINRLSLCWDILIPSFRILPSQSVLNLCTVFADFCTQIWIRDKGLPNL